MCGERLYLRQAVRGRRTPKEWAADLLRDHVWGGARITQWKPNGILMEQFGIQALNVTSCVFGGAKMNELFVTTARVGMDSAALKKYPQAGGVFRMGTNCTGTPTYEFGA